VPSFHALSSEEREMAWNYYVQHYQTDGQRDPKWVPDKGILYPRAGTLGGCTAHNAMITVVPHDVDWDDIAIRTNDETWHADNMWRYWQRLERCQYWPRPQPGEGNPSGHGFRGWLGTSKVDPSVALGDRNVTATIVGSLFRAARHLGGLAALVRRLVHRLLIGDDPNDIRNKAEFEGVTLTVPLATTYGVRNGAREFIRNTQEQYPDRLFLRMNNLATRVILDDDNRAVGVRCWEGKNLYRADPKAAQQPQYVEKEYRCTREVILSGGTFNTPQLLMLSGIGPKEHLASMGITCRVRLEGVGSNLQDRYEVGIVSEMKRPFSMMAGATFEPPVPNESPDPAFQEWQQGKGLYTSNGAMAAIILKSDPAREGPPDLFIFSLPGDFHGYYPGYSEQIVNKKKDTLTWAIVKAHTLNHAGTVRLRSSNPLDTPVVDFHYFDEGNDYKGQDLESVLNAVKFVRSMNAGNGMIKREMIPGPEHATDDQLRTWIKNNAWGHHASCTCKMGRTDDPTAVVDHRFRVIGAKGLRVVDASIFPKIPGFFIVTPIYMISEKAADVITEDAAQG
jgi:choline dehydrogenase